MDHVGSSKIKVKGFLKKAFIWLDRKEASTFIDGAPLKKVTQNREREIMIAQNIWYSELWGLARGGRTNIYNMYNG